MKPWAESFYGSSQWHKVRELVKARAFGLCEICGQPGIIAHHKIVLTPENIKDVNISLNTDLLIFVCLDCHNRIHGSNGEQRTAVFDSDGNLVDLDTIDYSQYIIG